MKQTAVTFVAAVAVGVTLSAAVSFKSTFKSMDAGRVSFLGKKVAAVIMTKDDGLRVTGEDALASELTARGMQGVATYKIAPKEELQKAETAKPWFEKAGVEGVVVLRPVSAETRTTYTPGTWVSPNYGTLWGYYGWGWSQMYIPGTTGTQDVITVENVIFDVASNQLVWAAVAEISDAKSLREGITQLAKASVKVMQEQGLAKGQPKK
jgi:hypothetical protein